MANRSDSGSSSAHQNQRPTSHNDDALPEMTEPRGRAEGESDEEYEEVEEVGDEEDEGSF